MSDEQTNLTVYAILLQQSAMAFRPTRSAHKPISWDYTESFWRSGYIRKVFAAS